MNYELAFYLLLIWVVGFFVFAAKFKTLSVYADVTEVVPTIFWPSVLLLIAGMMLIISVVWVFECVKTAANRLLPRVFN